MKINRKIVTFCILALFVLMQKPSIGQWPVTFAVQNFAQACNISSRTFTSLYKGKEGFIWIGTREGLIRFDGYDFKLFKNTNSNVNHIQFVSQDALGIIWCILSDNSLCSFENASQHFSNYKFLSTNKYWNEHLRLETIFFDANNKLWAGTKGYGLLQIDLQKNSIHQINLIPANDTFFKTESERFEYNRVSAICNDANGNLWLASPDGLYIYHPSHQQLNHYHMRPTNSKQWRNDFFQRISFLNRYCILGSWGGGISVFDTISKRFTVHKFDSTKLYSYTANIVHDLVPIDSQRMYIASADKGFMGFDVQKKHFTHFSHSQQYPYIPKWLWQNVISDKHGHYWALNDEGLIKITPGGTYFKYDKLQVSYSDNNIFYLPTDIFENQYYKIICTQFADGLHLIDKRNQKKSLVHVQKTGEPYELIYRIVPISNHLFWVVSRDFVYQLDAQNLHLKKMVLPSIFAEKKTPHFWCAQKDAKGQLWVGSLRSGVFVFDKQGFFSKNYHRLQSDKMQQIKENGISALTMDSCGNMWVASRKGMLQYFANNKWQSVVIDGFTLPSWQKVHDLYTDSLGHIWISSELGLIETEWRHSQLRLIRVIGIKKGLSYNLFTGLQQDAFGNIWAVSENEHEVICINRKNGIVQQFNNSNGINKPGWLFKFVPSFLYPFPTLLAHAGYYNIRQDNSNTFTQAKTVQLILTEININGKQANVTKEQPLLSILPNEKNLQFGFAAIDFNDKSNFEYEYSLQKQTTRWISNGNKRNLSLINLPSGDYELKIRALNNNHHYTNTIAIQVHVSTYFYEETWFWVLFAGLLLILILWIMNYKNQKENQILTLKAQTSALEKEKARMEYSILREHLNPHFLFNAFTSLSSLIRTNNEIAVNFLAQLSGIYRYILQNKNKDLVALDSEISFVNKYVDLQKTRFEGALFVEIHIPAHSLNQKIVPAALQGLIENALKHNIVSKNQPLLIHIFIQDAYLVIKNNLQTRAFVVGSNKQGLSNLKQLYHHYTDRPVEIIKTQESFFVKLPLV